MLKIIFLLCCCILPNNLSGQGIFLPQVTESENIIHHFAFSLLYSEKHEQPKWVAYTLTKEQLEYPKMSSRDGTEFVPDPDIKEGSANSEDYYDIKRIGIDRGHLIPAADVSWSFTAMKESFYYSNISPQYADFNRGIWLRLENQVREWGREKGKIYIVTGPVLTGEYKAIGPNNVSIPDYFYKVLLRYGKSDTTGIGFIIPNQRSSLDLLYYSVSIDSVEIFTGIDFFPSLPDRLEEKLESMTVK